MPRLRNEHKVEVSADAREKHARAPTPTPETHALAQASLTVYTGHRKQINCGFGGERLTGAVSAHPFWEILSTMGDGGTADDAYRIRVHDRNRNKKTPSG